MRGKFVDLSGRKFKRLLVVERVIVKTNPKTRWLCRCECGKETLVQGIALRIGATKSCGCLQREVSLQNIKHGAARKANGHSPEYDAWLSAKQRCFNPKNEAFKNYGGRGITMCDEWKTNFSAFLEHVGPRPNSKLSIDRYPNNDGNYQPGNVRWATRIQQANNRRKSQE